MFEKTAIKFSSPSNSSNGGVVANVMYDDNQYGSIDTLAEALEILKAQQDPFFS